MFFSPILAQGLPAIVLADWRVYPPSVAGHFSVNSLFHQHSGLPKKSSTVPMEGGAFDNSDSRKCAPLQSLLVAK
jgi:hypothetical protein